VEHPLLPFYLASIDGTTVGVQDGDPPDIHSFTDITVLTLLDTKGIPWITHVENYPGGCLDAVVNSESIYSKSCKILLLFSSKYHKLSTLLQTCRSIATKPISVVAITLPMAWNGNAAVGREEPMSCESALLKCPFLPKIKNPFKPLSVPPSFGRLVAKYF
jgi:hypothetical protein